MSDEWKVPSGKWKVRNEVLVESAEWKVSSIKYQVASGKWKVRNEESQINNKK